MLNEYDPKNKFYQLFNAEKLIYDLAKSFPKNAYVIGLFACCREIFNVDKHSGCVVDPQFKDVPQTEYPSEVSEETKEVKEDNTPVNYTGKADRMKFCLIWGCRPGQIVGQNT